MKQRLRTSIVIVVLAALAVGCAAGKAFRQGEVARKAGNLDEAVAFYRAAVHADPMNPNYKIALERAMTGASRVHFDRAKEFEEQDQLEAALGEYRQASELDPTNRVAAAKVAALDRTIRDRIEASRPKPAIQALRDRVRQQQAEPLLNPSSKEPLNIRFNNASLRDILNFIANATGINVMYDRDFTDRPTTVQLDGVTLDQGLNQLLSTNQYAYKVVNSRTILVFQDTAAKHAQYDEQVVRTFYLSHADATEVSQVLSGVIRLPGLAVQPAMLPNKTSNSITVRATAPVVDIIERIIQQNDKPRAEIVFDIEILEVDRNRAKQYGINLSEYALGGIFSPEVSPSATTTTTGGGTGAGAAPGAGTTTTAATGRAMSPTGALGAPPPAFNLNTITRGVTTADFFLAVPTAIVRFLESDTHTRLVAKPQLRGSEGTKLTLNLGDEVPIVSTSYTPIATGGVGVNPLNSFQLKPVGINVDITPRVTLEGDIIIELNVESSSVGPDKNIAGTNYPSFSSRKVGTKLRLRDGESNLLAGLLREDERRSLTGFPGAVHVPLLKQLFSANDESIAQTDIVMLLTPHIVRSHEITEEDLRPIFIGTQQNLGLSGPPALMGPAPAEAPPSAPAPAQPPAAAGVPGFPQTSMSGTVVTAPPGSTPVPGTVVVPAPQPPAPTAPQAAVPAAPAAPYAGTPATPPAAAPAAAPASAPATSGPQDATTSPGMGMAQVMVTPPGGTFRVGGGPYTVPISITNVSRLSTVTLTLTYDPAILRVRAVQEGSFMRSGSVNATFTQQTSPGRIDVTIVRSADATGASGTGLLAAVLFDAIGAGTATLTPSGSASGPGGTTMGVQFRPVTVTVQ